MKPTDSAEVREEARRIFRKHASDAAEEFDLPGHERELEVLLESVDEFMPVWRVLPSVYRVARIEAGGSTVAYSENTTLPAARQTVDLVLQMLNHIRTGRGLEQAKMPLLLYPDEIEFAMHNPAPCHCDEEREIAAQARGRRLGRKGVKRWLRTGTKVFDRDSWACTNCGTKKDLQVHAIDGGKSYLDPAGYVTLCRVCHVVDDGAPTAQAARLRDSLPTGAVDGSSITSQLALVFDKGALRWIGFAFGRRYVVLGPAA